jgi:hypothetical protein
LAGLHVNGILICSLKPHGRRDSVVITVSRSTHRKMQKQTTADIALNLLRITDLSDCMKAGALLPSPYLLSASTFAAQNLTCRY